MDRLNNGKGLSKLASPQRNHYFYGKLLDEFHLQMEQDYFNRKRWLLNRLGLGEGVLCGLDVTVKDGKVCVTSGVAIDALGREIIVPEAVCLDPLLVTDDCGQTEGVPLELDKNYHLCLAYRECAADFTPMLVTDCNTREQCAPGTVVESYCLFVSEGEPARPTTDPAVCEALTGALDADAVDTLAERRKRLAEQLSGPCAVSLEKTCVVLAEVELVKLEEPEAGVRVVVNTHGYQPVVVYSNAKLLDFILCLAEQDGGGSPGPAGTSVKSADAETGTPVEATFDPATGNIHFVIPPGQPGPAGVSVKSADAETGTPVDAIFDPATGNIHFVIPPGQPDSAGESVKSADAETGTPVDAIFDSATGNIHFVIPPGDPGPAGVSVKSADAETGPVDATFDPATGNIHFVIPPGQPGLDPDLTHICAINWIHPQVPPPNNDPSNNITPVANLQNVGLLVAFDKPVHNGDIHSQSFMVLEGPPDDQYTTWCWCELRATRIGGIHFNGDYPACKMPENFADPDIFTPVSDPDELVSWAQFKPQAAFKNGATYRVVLKGDFIRDEKDKGVDADHLPLWLPNRHTGDGVEGGTFESWFVLKGE